jgi:hypothetical protein
MSNPTPYRQKPSIMSFDKSTAIVWLAISLIFVETFSGALRFYLDKAGLALLMYGPKIACIVFFALELRNFKAGRGFWLCMLGVMLSGAWAMLNGAKLGNFGFALYSVSPLLFGITCGDQIARHKRLFMWVIGFFLMASVAGVLLDRYTDLPWKGYSYSIGNTEVSANTAWADDEADRPAGFGRMSSTSAVMISIFSLYLLGMLRSKTVALGLCAAGFVGVVLTTSKAPMLAFGITFALFTVMRFRWTLRSAVVVAVLFGMALPMMSMLFDFDPHQVTADTPLASFYDRLVNTWPNVINVLVAEGRTLTGVGFGLVGAAVAAFPVAGAQIFMISDSTVVYLWGMFGLAGLFLYALHIPLFFILADSVTRYGRALFTVSFCICVISWTTDTLEVTVANLFMGMAIGHALLGTSLQRVTLPKQSELKPWNGGLPSLH